MTTAIEQPRRLVLNGVEYWTAFDVLKAIKESAAAERATCARAVCPSCAAGDELVRTPIFTHSWSHKSLDHRGQEWLSSCAAAAIWERGREQEQAR